MFFTAHLLLCLCTMGSLLLDMILWTLTVIRKCLHWTWDKGKLPLYECSCVPGVFADDTCQVVWDCHWYAFHAWFEFWCVTWLVLKLLARAEWSTVTLKALVKVMKNTGLLRGKVVTYISELWACLFYIHVAPLWMQRIYSFVLFYLCPLGIRQDWHPMENIQ